MTSKRKGKGNSIPSIEESFLGISSKQREQQASSRPRKRKSRPTDSQANLQDAAHSHFKKRAASDSVLVNETQDQNKVGLNLSNLKIEAFDFFHRMLNQCCGSHVFDVFNTASILKQFTPDVMKAVIYVITENSKRVSPKLLTEAQTQTQAQDKTVVEEHHDIEISNITNMAKRKQTPSKWQPVPELVQPRLTSPVSNSCSPVSAAVQALMSFARNDDQMKNKADETATATGGSDPSEDCMECLEKDDLESSASLNVFESESLAPVSSSPFLQPMSSSLMLHTEVKRSPSFSETASSNKELKPKAESSHNADMIFRGGSGSSSFPWIKTPSKTDISVKCEVTKTTDKNLPSISSILAPIGSSFPDLNFRNLHKLSSSTVPHNNNSSSTATSRITDAQKNSLAPLGMVMPGLAAQNIGAQKLARASVLNNQINPIMDPRGAPMSPGPLLISTSVANATGFDGNLKVSPKTVFRKILPKPSKKKRVEKHTGHHYPRLIGDIGDDTKVSETDFTKGLNGDMKLSTDIGLLMQDSPPSHESIEKSMSYLQPEKQDSVGDLSAENSSGISPESYRQESSENENVFTAPLAGVISNIRQQGFVIKGLPPDQASTVPPPTSKKTSQSSNSGKLEVASALLSMGSTENETKQSGKVVSAFNKEKATFDIKESTSVQHGDILFTKTGTFQIEDIEIDPKKNKIEKDSYQCGKCGRVFTSLVYLARHIKRVCPDMTLRKWKCERCDKAFRHPFGLQQHIFTHTGERPFKCDECAKAFYSANDLRRHARTHSGERPYSCSHCNKCFSTTISLKTHTYIHTGERPHKCPHCPKTFATSSKLSRHVVTHSDKRPFACNICVKTFNRSGDLRRHYNNVHNIEHGLLSCDQCNKLFATQKCLDNHKMSHNRNLKQGETSENFRGTGNIKISRLMSGSYVIKTKIEE